MEIIRVENGQALLNQATITRIVEFEKDIKMLTEARDRLKEEIKKAMEAHGVVKFDSEQLQISYIQETDREVLDSKALRYDHPDIYDAYIKMSKVKPSIRIKVK